VPGASATRLFVLLATVSVATARAAPESIVAAARVEGRVVVHATTEASVAAPLLEDFSALYPEILIDYQKMESNTLYERFIEQVAHSGASADVLWSSAMDLQMKLANDGFAAAYQSPESDALPSWALWNGEAYGSTFEPIVFAYNRRLLQTEELPRSHAELVRLLRSRPDRFRGRVVTYDPEKSGLGYLLLTQDARVDPRFMDEVRALGSAGIGRSVSSLTMLEEIASGKYLLGVNVIGSYAAQFEASIGTIAPGDYTLAMSRIAIIPKAAAHPNAARVFLDYLLSRRGQTIIATRTSLGAIRSDVKGSVTAASLRERIGPALHPIPVSPVLLVFLDTLKRQAFHSKWREALAAGDSVR
jgi:iron(III) transport system substrate-binding protein